MNFHALLQTELWSKRTTRKLLRIVGTGFGILAVLVFSFYSFETRWLSRGERTAAKAALVKIEEMRNAGESSDDDFKARRQDAEASVESAKQIAVTSRDSHIAFVLEEYLDMIDVNRTAVRQKELMRARHIVFKHQDPKLDEELESNGRKVQDFLRMQLHTVLD